MLLILTNQVLGQQTDTLVVKQDPVDYQKFLNNFLKNYNPENNTDSMFIESYNFLDNYFASDSIRFGFNKVIEAVNMNVVDSMIMPFDAFIFKVDSLNSERQKLLRDYWQRQRLQHMLDTGGISSEDSLFVEVLGELMYQDSLNIDSVLKALEPYNDTLLKSIELKKSQYYNHKYANWIRTFRNDTIDMYLVNIEGDSLPVRLYNNNPSLIRFGLTDYWGSTIPAVIRNIEKRSFKIYVDDEPETDYIDEDKATKVLRGIINNKAERKLTLQPKVINIPEPVWSVKGRTNVDVSQVGMHQWAQGGDPSITLVSGIELSSNYKKDNKNWDNSGKFEYGVIRQGRYQDTAVHFRSNKDRMEIASKYGYKVFGKNYLTFEGDFKSQFAPKYNWNGNEKTEEKKSDFMSPGYLTFSLGIDYKPDDNTTIFAAPITNKSTYVLLDDVKVKSNYGVDTTKNARHEFGARIKATRKSKVWDDIEINNSIELFSNYLNNPQNVDVNWEMSIILPVNNYIRARVTTNLIYDDDTKVPGYKINDDGVEEKVDTKGVQFREIIAVGFTARF